MRVIDVLQKTVIGNYILREIVRQEIPTSCTLDIRVTLKGGEVKNLEFIKEAKK